MTTKRTLLAGTGLGILAAWLADLTILAFATTDAPVRVVTGWAPDGADLTVAETLLTSGSAVILAGAGLWSWQRRDPEAIRRWSLVVMSLAVLSAVPLWRLDVDTASKIALSMMHLATGACAVIGQRMPSMTR